MCEACEETSRRLDAIEACARRIVEGQKCLGRKLSRVDNRTRAMLGMLATGSERTKFWHGLSAPRRRQVEGLVRWARDHESALFDGGRILLAKGCRAAFRETSGGYRDWRAMYKFCRSHVEAMKSELFG